MYLVNDLEYNLERFREHTHSLNPQCAFRNV